MWRAAGNTPSEHGIVIRGPTTINDGVEVLSRRLISAAMVRGISRHPHAFACAKCERTRCSSAGRVDMPCRFCLVGCSGRFPPTGSSVQYEARCWTLSLQAKRVDEGG